MNDIERLEKIGFKKVAYWKVNQDNQKGQVIDYKLCVENLEKEYTNILYCFVIGDKIVYIGKSTKGFKHRMEQYKTPGPTQRTNIRINGLIKEELRQVDIYLFQDNGLLKYGEFTINLSAGLEDILIEKLKPEWNRGKHQNEKIIMDILKSGEVMNLSEVKEKSALSGKKWDKSIKNLTKNNVVKVEKQGEDLKIQLM